MSLREKYGWFELKDILLYDDNEREVFVYKIMRDLKEYLIRINGKKVMGHGPFKILSKEERDNLSYLNAYLYVDEENNLVTIGGYGHRRIVMPIEMWVREQFNQGRIVTYKGSDGLNRDNISTNEEAVRDELSDFYTECKRRLELFKKGELEPPKERAVMPVEKTL